MKYNISDYVLKVWLISVFAAPTILLILALIRQDLVSIFSIYLFTILIGGLFSLPGFLLLYLACKYLIKLINNTILFKLIVTVVGVALTYIPFLVLDNFKPLLDGGYLTQLIFISYCLVVVIGIWLYKPELINNDQPVMINETGTFI
jgi:hypothetical protein